MHIQVKVPKFGIWSKLSGSISDLISYKNWIDHNILDCSQWMGNDVYVLTGALSQLNCLTTTDKIILENHPNIKYIADLLVQTGILRVYQVEAAIAAISSIGRGIIKAPPGAGKTRICAAICLFGAVLGMSHWHYVVKNDELVKQAHLEILETLDCMFTCISEHGFLTTAEDELLITASTFGRLKDVKHRMLDGLLIDECHTIAAKSRALAYSEVNAYFRIGLSGTPLDRSDNKNDLTIGLLGPVVYEIERSKLLEEKHLAPSNVRNLIIMPNGHYQIRNLH